MYSRVTTIPGEFEVAHLTDIVHLNSVESVTGVANGGGVLGGTISALGNGSGGGGLLADESGVGAVDSWLHASVSAQAQSSFWRGNLHLSNYQLTFIVNDGAHTGHHALGYHSAPAALALDPATLTAADLAHAHAHALPLHPNLDASNFALLHVPVGSIFKMEYSKYAGFAPPKKEKAGDSGAGDYSSFSADSYSVAAASAAAAAADSTLRGIEFQLTITCRDARVLSFGILRRASTQPAASAADGTLAGALAAATQGPEDRAASVAEFLRLLKKYAFPKETRKLFAFSYGAGGGRAAMTGVSGDGRAAPVSHAEGWACYDVVREFARMGVGVHPADASLGQSLVHPRRRAQWRLDKLTNARFEFSPTYPQAYWLPAALTEKELGKVKGFRSKARIPALVYNYSDLLDYQGLGLSAQSYPDTVMLRAAQPNVGWTFGRCAADERLLELAQVRVIIDARPYANAVANQAKGGGYENAEHYKQCRIEFMGIENIHVMRNSLSNLLDLLRANSLNAYASGQSSSGDDWWGGLQQSGWLKHVRILLEGAVVCANYIKNGTSILVHCSDGWDRTSQLTSLSQLMLDPYYRTRSGFAVLVEKEWISFGHQFHKRCGHGHKEASEGQERSPIFYQFLDAVWQMQQQHPCSFEFNADYLACVADHLYSSKFGTFLHDNERLRALDHVKQTTQSLWAEINSEARREQFRNPLYGAGGVATPVGAGAGGTRAHGHAGPNNPSMNLSALSGAELGRAAFLHISADPRRIGIWPFWYRWERRKQNHAPLMHHPHTAAQLHLTNAAAMAVPSLADASGALTLPSSSSLHAGHLHHSPLAQLMSFTLGQLAQERARMAALESTVAALENDAKRLDATLMSRTLEANAARVLRGEQPHALPTTFRQVHAAGGGGGPHHALAHAPNHESGCPGAGVSGVSGQRVVPPPPPPPVRGQAATPRSTLSTTSNGAPSSTPLASPSSSSSSSSDTAAGASTAPSLAALGGRRVGATNTRGSIISPDGKNARGSIMQFGSNPLLDTDELPSPLTALADDSDDDEGATGEAPSMSSPSQVRLPPPPPLPAGVVAQLPGAALSPTTARLLPHGFVPPLPAGPPPAPRVAPVVPAQATNAGAPAHASSAGAPESVVAASATPTAADGDAGAAPVGPPQFRISASAFQNVKLKSTAKRFEMAASFTSSAGAVPAPVPAPSDQQAQPHTAVALSPSASTSAPSTGSTSAAGTPPLASTGAPASALLSAALAAETEGLETLDAGVATVRAVTAVAPVPSPTAAAVAAATAPATATAAPSRSLLAAVALDSNADGAEQLDMRASLSLLAPVAAAGLPPPPPPPSVLAATAAVPAAAAAAAAPTAVSTSPSTSASIVPTVPRVGGSISHPPAPLRKPPPPPLHASALHELEMDLPPPPHA